MLVEVVGDVELQHAEGPEAGAQLPRELVEEPLDLAHRVAEEVGALVLENRRALADRLHASLELGKLFVVLVLLPPRLLPVPAPPVGIGQRARGSAHLPQGLDVVELVAEEVAHLHLQQLGLGLEGEGPVLMQVAHLLEGVLHLAALEGLGEQVVDVAGGGADAVVELRDVPQDLYRVGETEEQLVVELLHLAEVGL